MGILKRRTRLISFRLSDDEYQALLEITAIQGARSISDFSRTALRQVMKGNSSTLNQESEGAFSNHVQDLIRSMQELGSVITKLSGQIEKDSAGLTRRVT